MLNQFITLPETQVILNPARMSGLAGALRNSLNTWNTAFASAQMVLDRSGRAIMINQYWYHFANLGLAGDQGVEPGRDQLQRFIKIDDRIFLRFKLLDENFESSNYPTPHAVRLRHQQISFPGFPKSEWLEFGYRLDITGTVLQDAFILLRVGKRVVWLWQIGGSQIGTFPIQFELRPSGTPAPYVFDYTQYV